MYQTYRNLVRYFRDNLPLPVPVLIRRVKLRRGLDGLCVCSRGGFSVQVSRTLTEEFAIEVLIHELAHVLSWGKDADSHGPAWGKAYSLVYRKFLRWSEQHQAA